VRGHTSEGRRWLGEALAEERSGSAARAKALRGGLASHLSRRPGAGEVLEESLALYRVLGDDAGTVRTLTFLGFKAFFRGDLERAGTLGAEALALSRRLDDRWGPGAALEVFARTAHERDDQEGAAALREEALALARKAGDAWSATYPLINGGGRRWSGATLSGPRGCSKKP
jgi:hypothetical protein